MNPAPSVIIFTVLSGMGFGLLAFLGAGLPAPAGWPAFFHWGLGYALAVGGLLASTTHLGNPQRAWRAFSQWRTSWLSREGVAAVAALMTLAPMALSDWLGLGWPRMIGLAGAALSLATIVATAMIYAQLKSVPRWNHWTTPALFMGFALAGGAILAGQGAAAMLACAVLGAVLLAAFHIGDGAFARRAQTMGTATGLGGIGPVQGPVLGTVRVFEQPHTSPNYLMREMIYLVARKHIPRLRAIAIGGAAVLPCAILAVLPHSMPALALAALLHLIGAAAARWLFFAQAEHVVGLYYGAR